MTSYSQGTRYTTINYEPLIGAPLDARMRAFTTEALTNGEILTKYQGMIVSVTNDPSGTKNGLYRLRNPIIPGIDMRSNDWDQIVTYSSIGTHNLSVQDLEIGGDLSCGGNFTLTGFASIEDKVVITSDDVSINLFILKKIYM